jgi:hypothetical protein
MTWCDDVGEQKYLIVGIGYLQSARPPGVDVQVARIRSLGVLAEFGGPAPRTSVGFLSGQSVRVPADGTNVVVDAQAEGGQLKVHAVTLPADRDLIAENKNKKRAEDEDLKQTWLYFGGCRNPGGPDVGVPALAR